MKPAATQSGRVGVRTRGAVSRRRTAGPFQNSPRPAARGTKSRSGSRVKSVAVRTLDRTWHPYVSPRSRLAWTRHAGLRHARSIIQVAARRGAAPPVASGYGRARTKGCRGVVPDGAKNTSAFLETKQSGDCHGQSLFFVRASTTTRYTTPSAENASRDWL